MKRFYFFAIAISLVCAIACQREAEPQPLAPATKTMTIYAGSAGTRTSVQISGSDYNVTWNAGDLIQVAEIIYANYGLKEGPSPFQIVQSEQLTADAVNAEFTVNLSDRSGENPENDSFRYVGVYPWSCFYDLRWTGDNRAEWEEHWGDNTTPDHTTVMVGIPTLQYPTADSFDPNADLMVSEMVVSPTQPSSLTMRFARVGTIAKITLKGLPAGKTIQEGQFSFPIDGPWPGAYMVEYDPVLGGTGLFSKGSGNIWFYPNDLVVDGEGNAVLWLRTLSGTLSGWFYFKVSLSDGKSEPEQYEKRVDLKALNKTISFPESGVTTFSVSMEKRYELTMNMESNEVTETSVTLNMHYDLGGKPHTTASYGLIRFDPETPDPLETVRLSTASPSDIIYLIPDAEGKVSHTDSDLAPDTDYCFMPFIVVDGQDYYPEYMYFTLHTLKHYDYAQPELVDLGLPSGTKWASFNLGSDAPLTAGYYYAWGEVRPTDYFSSGYSSKYWYQYRYDYPGYAYKYSTCATDGMDNLVDMKTVLDPEDDAATVALGDGWRTPTDADFGELFENCDRSVLAGETGYVFTSKINGNSITFPACGYYNGATKSGETIMMTSSLAVDGITYHNNVWCAKIAWSQSGYTETNGATRGHMRFNVRPVKGGVRAGYTWTAHTSVSGIGAGSATVFAEYLVPEDLSTFYDYKYTTHIGTDPLGYFPGTEISRNGNHIYNGLTPGTTYYYFVSWECKQKVGSDTYYSGGASEVRSFVAE